MRIFGTHGTSGRGCATGARPWCPPPCDYCPSQYVFIVYGRLTCWEHVERALREEGYATKGRAEARR